MRRHITLALVLSSAGFVLAVVYALYAEPNVVLVAVLIETMLTLLLVATMKLIPYEVLHRQAMLPPVRLTRQVLLSAVAGAFAFVVAWGALSQPPAGQTVAEDHVRLAPEAHAQNVVTGILADFRGLDTLGEITVVALVLLGVATLLGGEVPAAVGGAQQPAARVVTRAVARLLYLPTLLVAAAILLKGFVETGVGFSAGVAGALGVLLRYLAFGPDPPATAWHRARPSGDPRADDSGPLRLRSVLGGLRLRGRGGVVLRPRHRQRGRVRGPREAFAKG